MIHTGDCLEVMPTLPAESIDAIVTDPPYGLSFMGREWDHGLPGIPFWREALRVAKPGAHLLAFGGTRTYHRLACAIEDAGWEVRDVVCWAYAQGFPKSLDVSKAIDKAAGATRRIVRERDWHDPMDTPYRKHYGGDGPEGQPVVNVTAPATPDAVRWQGWGTALKPAWEPIILARKPLRGTVAANVTEYGTGALNIDGCRIATDENLNGGAYAEVGGRTESQSLHAGSGMNVPGATTGKEYVQPSGRWPANLVLTDPIFDGDTPGVVGGGMQSGGGNPPHRQAERTSDGVTMGGGWQDYPTGKVPVDTEGSYSRFFLIPKASRADREPVAGGLEVDADKPLGALGNKFCTLCGESWVAADGWPKCGHGRENTGRRPAVNPKARANHHPTVKPVALMRHLVRLVTPPGGTVLDPFLGSGTTALACEAEGFGWVGIEKEEEYVKIAEARLHHAQKGMGL